MFDVLIKGGLVVDGSGGPAVSADVGITGERIEAIGDLSSSEAKRTINATGHVVSPGFIDTHAHSDGALLIDPQHASGLRQGITTEFLGQDGLSYAPMSSENYQMYSQYLSGILGRPPGDLDMSSVTAFRANYHKKCAINTAYCVPHGAIRLSTVGFTDAPLEGADLDKAKGLVRESVEQGASAFSTGMSYFPNAWSTTEELVELCKSANEAGAVYVTHLRDVHKERGFGGGGVEEALEIGRRSGIKVHFSHFRTNPEDVGVMTAAEKIAPVDAAKGDVDSTLELYPYPIGSSFVLMTLDSASQEGGTEAILKRLSNPTERQALVDSINNYNVRPLDQMVFTNLPKHPKLEGMGLFDVARMQNKTPGDVVCDLLLDEELTAGFRGAPPISVGITRLLARDQMELLSRPDYMVGSDQIPVGGLPHPRAYGTFPRFLGRFRRSMPDVMSLETMVQRVTDNPARRFGLTDRGRIEKGYFADVVVFDPDSMIDTATFDDPHQFPVGIPYVLVNGQVAADDAVCTGVMAGHAVP
jgi:N-acyl-D-amino-acid deacylase